MAAASGASSDARHPGIVSAVIRGGELTVTLTDGRLRSLPVDPDTTVLGVTDLAGDGATAVLGRVGQGASTELDGIFALDPGGRLVAVVAPVGEPGAGEPWQISVGASAARASGLRCGPPALQLITLEAGDAGSVTITTRAYTLAGGAAQQAAAPTVVTVSRDSDQARAVGGLGCPGL
jgi:hypothetical protein